MRIDIRIKVKRNWWTCFVSYGLAYLVRFGVLSGERAKTIGVRLLRRNIITYTIIPEGSSDGNKENES